MKKLLSTALVLCIVFAVCVPSYARLVGDVNRDGKTNSSDALEVLKYSVKKITTIDELMADVNKDGKINSTDALSILKIAVGSYTGPTEVDDELITTFKKDKIDPILQTGKYTISTTVISNDTSIPSTIMVRDHDMCVEMTVDLIKIRILVLDGKCYITIPLLKVYGESSVAPPEGIDSGKADYVKSEYYKFDGKTYVVETYKSDTGETVKYYFLNGIWKTTQKTGVDGTVSTQRIDGFKAGVDESYFSLKGYKKVNIDDYIK